MFNYLYYKLYQATLKGSLKDVPQFITPFYFAALISVNILVINAFLAKVGVMAYFFLNKKLAIVLVLLLVGIAYIYYNKSRTDALIEKYIKESNSKRIKGNIIVSMYIAISFLSIFAVAFFRPGKL